MRLGGSAQRGAVLLRRCWAPAAGTRTRTAAAASALMPPVSVPQAMASGAVHVPARTFCTSTTVSLGRRFSGGSRKKRAREPMKGDWLCQCGEVNYQSKRECFKCGAPAPPLPPGVRRPSFPGEDPMDWACPCGQMNFRASVLCHKCQQPKPDPPPLPGKEVTMWTCPKCKAINRSSRKFCYKCSVPSPLTDFKPAL